MEFPTIQIDGTPLQITAKSSYYGGWAVVLRKFQLDGRGNPLLNEDGEEKKPTEFYLSASEFKVLVENEQAVSNRCQELEGEIARDIERTDRVSVFYLIYSC